MKMKNIRFGFLPALFRVSWIAFSLPAAHATLQSDLNQLIRNDAPSQSQWSMLVEDLDTGKTLYSLNPDYGLIPASNMKILVCAAALLRLGPDYTYATTLYKSGEQNGSTLKGDLIVVGSGDPSIGGRFNNGNMTELFRQWAAVLKQKNLLSVTGDVIGVDDIFDDIRHGLNWHPDDFNEWYAAEVSGLTLNDACIDLMVQGAAKASQPATIRTNPPTHYLEIQNDVRTTTAGRNGESVRIEREPDSRDVIVHGSVPPKRESIRYTPVPNPTLYFTTVLKETLESEGITIKGVPRDADDGKAIPDKKNRDLLHTYHSPPLARLVEVCLKNSQNLYAEHFLKTVGAVEYGVGSLTTGSLAVKDVLFENGCDIDNQYIADGSGLSRENRISAHVFVRTLRAVLKSAYAQYFIDGLPNAGVDGTLKFRMRNTNAYSNVIAKTGTLNGVRALSGFIHAESDKTYVFSIIANGPHAAPRFTQIMDDICDLISSQG